jgi:hypothetical protein
MLFALAFLPMFGIGGLTGLPLGLSATDIHLHDDTLSIDGRDWLGIESVPSSADSGGDAGAPLSEEPCADALPQLEIGRDHTITFSLDTRANPADRESLDGDRRETLVFSHLSTHDGLERPFSFIDDGSDGSFTVSWTLDAELDVPPSGTRFDFFLTARDGRGGADWLHRQACAVPSRD